MQVKNRERTLLIIITAVCLLFIGTTVANAYSNDSTPPNLNVSPDSGTINAGASITATASDESGICDIGYYWDDDNIKQVVSSSTQIIAPSTTGTHTLSIYARDNSGNLNYTGWQTYTYTIGGSNNSSYDTTVPSISLSQDSGTLNAGSTITVTASDSSGINHIGYSWDYAPTTAIYSNSASIIVPYTMGTHTLSVYAKDNSSNYNLTGWKDYTYTVAGSNSSDTIAPTLSVSPSSGTISAGATVTIAASDSSGINHIGYAWDNNSTTPVYSTSTTVSAPSTTGTHTLYVYAKDNSWNYNSTGWKEYTFNIGSNDTTVPTLSVSPSSGTINAGTTITVVASDSSGINHIGYAWDNNSTTPIYSSSATITAPSTTGTHTLYVYAKDNSSNYNLTGWKSYPFNIGSNDNVGPTLSVSPSSGTIRTGATITITASDSSGINHIGYAWDDGITTPIYSSSATITAPSTTGTHTLYVYAKDNSSNHNLTGWKSYPFNIGSNDNVGPTLSVSPSSGTIRTGATITITASDSSGISHIGYAWDDSGTTPIYSSSATITAPSTTGTHTLYVYAKDNSSDHNLTGWNSYPFSVVAYTCN